MWQVISTYVRPNTTVDFFNFPKMDAILSAQVKAHVKETYESTGKQIFVLHELSDDALTMTGTGIWESQAVWEEFKQDPIVSEHFLAVQQEYNRINNIVLSNQITSEI